MLELHKTPKKQQHKRMEHQLQTNTTTHHKLQHMPTTIQTQPIQKNKHMQPMPTTKTQQNKHHTKKRKQTNMPPNNTTTKKQIAEYIKHTQRKQKCSCQQQAEWKIIKHKKITKYYCNKHRNFKNTYIFRGKTYNNKTWTQKTQSNPKNKK